MKLEIGSKYNFRTDDEEDFLCEVISHNDPRLEKPACYTDVCLYFPELDWANTYDLDMVLKHLEET